MEATRLLLVDDDDSFRRLLAGELADRGHAVVGAPGVARACALLDRRDFDVAVVDLRLGAESGLDVLRHVRERHPDVEVIMLTGHGTIESAIDAIRTGAFDYLRKPCSLEELDVAIFKACERQRLVRANSILRDGLTPSAAPADMVGDSPAIRSARSLVGRVAPADSSVLILGETGVGKEVVARSIHALSRRAGRPMVVVDCTTLHADLLESELFGYEKGAFTGAGQTRHGLFEAADGGTVLLDEVGDLSGAAQTRLLRVLETGSFRRVGGTREIAVDVRVLAATNRDLREMMKRGLFRSDLYFRLCTFRLELPPLRARPEDIPPLAEHFLDRLAARFDRPKKLTPAALEALRRARWPGNVRELLHTIERASVMADSEWIDLDHLPAELRAVAALPRRPLTLRELEERHVREVLHSVDGNRAEAAELLGISERTLYRKVKALGL